MQDGRQSACLQENQGARQPHDTRCGLGMAGRRFVRGQRQLGGAALAALVGHPHKQHGRRGTRLNGVPEGRSGPMQMECRHLHMPRQSFPRFALEQLQCIKTGHCSAALTAELLERSSW